jgi:hippurate hydrolase
MTLKTALIGGAGILLALGAQAGGAQALDVLAVKAQIDQGLSSDYPHLDALYKDIHAHPELGFQEQATAAKLAKEMRGLGLEVTEGVGKTGVVAILRNGPGPMVLVRTELDALPLEEKTGLPYASAAHQMREGKDTFVDHACGHDIHMAVWVGVAKQLVALKKSWSGTVMFIGQPAEETTGGAKAMLDDHLFQRFGKPDLGFALHVGPEETGTVDFKSGVLTSNSDELHVIFHGQGAHGSMPNKGVDPILEMSKFIVDVQSVISREKDPQAFGVITVGSVQAGVAGNVIPDMARLSGTIRSYDAGVRAKMLAGIDRTAKAEAEMAGAPPPEVRIVEGGKAVINDEAITERTAAVFKKAFGDKAIRLTSPSPPSEDYSEFILAGVPSLFFGIGGSDPAIIAAARAGGKPVPVNHSPFFAPVPEPTIKTGVEAMTLAVISALPRK